MSNKSFETKTNVRINHDCKHGITSTLQIFQIFHDTTIFSVQSYNFRRTTDNTGKVSHSTLLSEMFTVLNTNYSCCQ